MTYSPKIAILGAGPSGLTLGRILHLSSVPFTIYELDANPRERDQGGTLDLHKSSGQAAIEACDLTPRFHELMRTEGEAVRIADKTTKLYVDNNEPGMNRPEIDRLQLRLMLAASVPAKHIQWGRKAAGVEAADDENPGKWRVKFADGSLSTATYDLIVGADGAWSRVRSALTDVRPHYSGVTAINLGFLDVDVKHPKVSALVGKGSYYCFCETKAIIGQRNGDGSIRCYGILRVPFEWQETCGIDWNSPSSIKSKLLAEDKYFATWAPELKAIIETADEANMMVRKLHMLPVGHRWEHKAGLTMVGDAAHLMTPFAGVGVNMAMQDSMELAAALKGVESGEALDKAVKGFEEVMWKRGEENAAMTWESCELCFKEDAPKGFLEYMMKKYQMGTEAKEGENGQVKHEEK